MKKYFVCSVLLFVFFLFSSSASVFAMPIGIHYYLGQKVLERLEKIEPERFKLSESERSAFLDGNVYADVGRLKFDKETGKDSDKKEFVDSLFKTSDTEEEKWFSRGFRLHSKVDDETDAALKDIFGEPDKPFVYLDWYGVLDNYVILKTKKYIDAPLVENFDIDEVFEVLPKKKRNFKFKLKKLFFKIMMFFLGGARGLLKHYYGLEGEQHVVKDSYVGLLEKNYRILADYCVSKDDIKRQFANLVGSSIVICTKERNFKLDEAFLEKVDKKISDLAENLVKNIINSKSESWEDI